MSVACGGQSAHCFIAAVFARLVSIWVRIIVFNVSLACAERSAGVQWTGCAGTCAHLDWAELVDEVMHVDADEANVLDEALGVGRRPRAVQRGQRGRRGEERRHERRV